MGAGPDIAVIVNDFGRRRFLRSAVRSVLGQTLPRDRFEIAVTKSYRDEALDGELADARATVLFDTDPCVGARLGRAIVRTSAPILAFLDDDDEFEPGRLARIVDVLDRYPGVGFYRNRVAVVDGAGRPVPADAQGPLERAPELDRTGPLLVPGTDTARLFALARGTYATFNSSSMAIRREILGGDIGEWFLRSHLPDHFSFLAAALAGRDVFLDDQRLTRYRRYGANTSNQARWLGAAESSYADMAVMAARHGGGELGPWFEELAVHYGRMFRGSSLVERVAGDGGRREIAWRTGDYLRFLGAHPRERAWTLDTWAAGAYGLAYVGAPGLAKRIARARLAARAPR